MAVNRSKDGNEASVLRRGSTFEETERGKGKAFREMLKAGVLRRKMLEGVVKML